MDSTSKSQLSQPPSDSDPGSGSRSGYDASASASDSRNRSTFDDFTQESSPSAGNSTPQDNINNSSSSMQSIDSQLPEDEEDMDVDITGNSSSTGKEKEVETGDREGTAEESGLLLDLYSLHNKTGRYLFSGGNGKRDFYKFWIEEEGDYANEKELDEKINELHERFLKNMDKNVDGPTDPVDIDILRYSEWIWGNEIDSFEETDHDDDQEQDFKDLPDNNPVDQEQDSAKSSSKADGKGSADS